MATLNETNYKKVAGIIAIIVAAGLAISLIILAICGNQLPTVTIDYAGEKQSAKIVVNGQEKDVTDEVETVESVDVNGVNEVDAEQEDAQGAWHNTATYEDYYNSVGIGNCINNKYGAQCFALASDFWSNYTGRALSSCGTGAAKGTLNCYSYNAGGEFEMIWDATQLQPGDWVVFNGGEWGHIGMAMGYYNNGYITLFGQNQGGGNCSGGGAATNVINISLKNFAGAFRPKSYIKVTPTPTPSKEETKTQTTTTTEPCAVGSTIKVVKGDTMGKIMKRCYGYTKWGSAMNAFAQTWVSTVKKPGQIVYDGWNKYPGVGLYAGDTIKRIK